MAPSLPSAAAFVAAATASVVAVRAVNERYSISSDLAQIRAARKSKQHLQHLCQIYGEDDWSFYHILHGDHASTYGSEKNALNECFLFEDRSWTYGQVRAEVGRVAIALQDMGVKNRTVVAMFINNSPEFFFLWWALFKIGAIPAPLNTSIAKEPLRHCLKISEAELLVYTYELSDVIAASLDLADGVDARIPTLKTITVYDYNTYLPTSLPPTVHLIKHTSLPPATKETASWPPSSRPHLTKTSISQYLFTSGTTGLPKAATFPTCFVHMIANPWRWPVMFQEHDKFGRPRKLRRAYICTPMFHGGATYALLPAVIAQGGTIILARRFSVRNFWHDVRRTRANMLFYIGEMARYLVQAPKDAILGDPMFGKGHEIEIMYGMGMAAHTWREFRRRFGVPWIAEYYGSTEGTTAICYSDEKGGRGEAAKVGHWGPLMRYMQDSFYIAKVDLESGEVVRDEKTGLCKEVEFGEVGEAVTRIAEPFASSHDYVGPEGAKATEKKILRDVFAKGDAFVRLGDALSIDSRGYFTFHDRLGDTFRAKGHNISTAEVENAFLDHPQIASANVVAVDMKQYGYEGQLGLAAVNLRRGADVDAASEDELVAVRELENHLVEKSGLAGYAVPRFLRVLVDLDAAEVEKREQETKTDSVGSEYISPIMKKLKTELKKEGISPPPASKDRMYWIENEGSGFVEFTGDMRRRLVGSRARL